MIKPDYKEVAAQLRMPSGDEGLKTAERMAENNGNMISLSIDKLNIVDSDRILEIGPGGGMHVPYLFKKANNLCYHGVDISETMINLAIENNEILLNEKEVSFTLVNSVDGFVKFPFQDNYFDKVFTVNTIYFWDNAEEQAQEIVRVVKPNGSLLLCFADETFMKNMPFTQYDFRLYNINAAKSLLVAAGLCVENISSENEIITAIHGEKFERKIHFIQAKKTKTDNR